MNPCGAAVDWGRRPYTTVARIFNTVDSPTVLLRWYVTDQPFQKFPSFVNSLDWDEEPYRPRQLGEVFGESRRYNGLWLVPGLKPGHQCGEPYQFIEGVPYDPSITPRVYDADWIPSCCGREMVGNANAGCGAAGSLTVPAILSASPTAGSTASGSELLTAILTAAGMVGNTASGELVRAGVLDATATAGSTASGELVRTGVLDATATAGGTASGELVRAGVLDATATAGGTASGSELLTAILTAAGMVGNTASGEMVRVGQLLADARAGGQMVGGLVRVGQLLADARAGGQLNALLQRFAFLLADPIAGDGADGVLFRVGQLLASAQTGDTAAGLLVLRALLTASAQTGDTAAGSLTVIPASLTPGASCAAATTVSFGSAFGATIPGGVTVHWWKISGLTAGNSYHLTSNILGNPSDPGLSVREGSCPLPSPLLLTNDGGGRYHWTAGATSEFVTVTAPFSGSFTYSITLATGP